MDRARSLSFWRRLGQPLLAGMAAVLLPAVPAMAAADPGIVAPAPETAPTYPRLVLQSQLAGEGDLVNRVGYPALDAGDVIEPWQIAVDVMGNLTIDANIRRNDESFCRPLQMGYPLGASGAWSYQRGADAMEPCLESGQDSGVVRSHDGRRVAHAADSSIVAAIIQAAFVDTVGLVFDLAASRFSPPIVRKGYYGRAAWLADHRLLLTQSFDARGQSAPGDAPRPANPARIVDVDSGQAVGAPIPDKCFVTPLSDGSLIGAGLANCYQDDRGPRGLLRWRDGQGWQEVAAAALCGATISQPAIDLATGAVRARARFSAEATNDLGFAADGHSVSLTLDYAPARWDLGTAPPQPLGTAVSTSAIASATVSSQSDHWVEYDHENMQLVSVSVAGGKRRTWLGYGWVVAEGAVPGSDLRYAVTAADGVHFWRPRPDAPRANGEVLGLTLVGEDHFFALAPDRRYDTDLGADTNAFRWVVSDAPFQSLEPQTYMHDFYTPRLAQRLLDCDQSGGDCARALAPVPSIIDLNRVLPVVTIDRVGSGARPDLATVGLTVRPGLRADAPHGRTRSDGYDLRLFRDGALVASTGHEANSGQASKVDLAAWRQATHLVPGPDGASHVRLTVALPTGPDAAKARFTAYAFNEDRVKSTTARAEYQRPPVPARARRVFVLAIGIDHYAEDRLRLRFSGSDARLIAARFGALPAGFEPHVTALFRRIDAGDMAFVIDACHSAASVDAGPSGGSFRAGPMGDPGLGQLAFDKGLRVLAATQADDVAMEDTALGQGLLTWVLAHDGLTPTGGKADTDAQGRIRLDGWLRYGARALPGLSADVRLGRFAGAAGTARGFDIGPVPADARPRPQEPTLFYFAGHGALLDDDQVQDQASGENSTILPWDARNPNPADDTPTDILDRELRGLINRAVLRGINVVTMFDSCHSGTAMRAFAAGRARTAPPFKAKGPQPDVPAAAGPGYWAHMAASSDDELSFEVPQPDGKVGGVFTMALAQTLRGLTSPASATLGDIADEVRARVVATGARDQHPAAEGQLEATLGGPARRVALVGATMAGGAVSLDAGAASGMTVGSTFALYRGRASALAEPPGKPLGTGHIGAVAPFTASLMLDGAAAGSPQSAMQARETAHVYGERVLRAALGRLATVQALMALRTDPASAALGLSVSDCAGRATAGPIGVGRDVTITIANRDPGHARYLYVFGIDETQAVYPFIPVVGGRDPAVPPTQALNQRLAFNAPGQYHFVAPASPMAGLQKGVTP